MRTLFRAAATAIALTSWGVLPAWSCSLNAPACEIPEGSYHIALPPSPAPEGGYQVVVFLHGAGGTSNGIMRMRQMIEPLRARGYAVLAPQGLSWRGGEGGIWSFLPESTRPKARDEAAFFQKVLTDARIRHGLSDEKAILAGFSAGGFMVSYLACERPGDFAAYAPVAGGFWRPHPKTCAGPVRLMHAHGWMDRTVPLEGRPLGARFVQGDIFEGMALWRDANGCESPAPTATRRDGSVLYRSWDCAPESALSLVLFPDGHRVPSLWADIMLDWMEALS